MVCDKLNTFSSGRLNDWKTIIKNNQNIILGNGVMGDRYLIKQSASNLIIYSYASSGILGVFLVIYIYLYTFFFSILTIIRKPNDSCFENYKLISIVCLFVLMLRSTLETSYGIFGIDLILFCFFISLTAYEKNK